MGKVGGVVANWGNWGGWWLSAWFYSLHPTFPTAPTYPTLRGFVTCAPAPAWSSYQVVAVHLHNETIPRNRPTAPSTTDMAPSRAATRGMASVADQAQTNSSQRPAFSKVNDAGRFNFTPSFARVAESSEIPVLPTPAGPRATAKTRLPPWQMAITLPARANGRWDKSKRTMSLMTSRSGALRTVSSTGPFFSLAIYPPSWLRTLIDRPMH